MDAVIKECEARAEHPTIKRMIRLWDQKRAGRAAPLRSDFDPSEMSFALGDLSLFDVEADPRRFLCRLDGTRQVELFGVDCTGKYLDDCLPADFYVLAHQTFSDSVDRGQPSLYQRRIPYLGRQIRYEVALLPLSRDGDRVDMLMVALVPHWD